MQTSALITLAQKQFPDWSRVMILEVLNDLQRIIFSQNATKQMRMIDSTTGKDPILTTIIGTRTYNIDINNSFNNNAWRVYTVYSQDITDPEDVTSLDATPSNSAQVIFKDDPNGLKYYIRAYRIPNLLTTEQVQLEVPESYHITHVYEGLCGFIEKFRSGKSDRWDIFEQKKLPELVRKMSDTEDYFFVTPRGF